MIKSVSSLCEMKFPFSYRSLRRVSQILFLVLFLVLFRLTEYSGKDEIVSGVTLFFRWDLLAGLSAMLALKEIITAFYPCLIILCLTIIFGRVFCGWVCPLGTLLDGAASVVRRKSRQTSGLRRVKYILLTVVLVCSLFELQLAGFFDPFAILFRGLSFSIDPALNFLTTGFFNYIYLHFPSWVTAITEPVYQFFKSTLLPYKQTFFPLSLLSFIILAVIVFLEKYEKRFWCKNLCPLGALLGILSRFSFLKRFPAKACPDCRQCLDDCRMNAFDKDGSVLAEECNLCMDCVADCEKSIAGFRFKRPGRKNTALPDRRLFVKTALYSLSLPLVSQISLYRNTRNQWLLRPPGAVDENMFSSLCIRCGECMKICINNALKPDFLENGYESLYTPRLMPRAGYCEFDCTLCGQACPTGAIQKLSMDEKHTFIIGKAYFDKNRCLPYAENTPCIVCEEHCPVNNKAIKFNVVDTVKPDGERITLKQPYIIKERCIGCGVCENVCPIEGNAAIRVINSGNTSQDI